jgi:hypothetical protein
MEWYTAPDDMERRQIELKTTRKEKNTKEVRGKTNIAWLEGFFLLVLMIGTA